MTTTSRTCPRCAGSGRYSRGTCFTCNGAGRVAKAVEVEERLARVVWPGLGAGGWMSPSMAEVVASNNPGCTVEVVTRLVTKRVPV